MKRFVEWLVKNQVPLLFSLAVLLAGSVWSFYRLPKDVFPNAAFPRFRVVADNGFASLENTDIGMTRPLEEALKSVPDVQELRSVTERGTSTIDLYLRWGADLDKDYQAVQARVDQARSELPAMVSIEITRMTTSAYPMSEYGLWSETLDPKQLYGLARYSVVPRLLGIEGVAGISLIGGEKPEIWVKLDPRKLVDFNLDATAIETALDNANRISFIGKVDQGSQSLFVVGGRKLADAAALRGIVVASRMGRPILLSDIAEVDEASAELRRIITVNGHPGLILDVRKQPAADGLSVSTAMDERMAEITHATAGLHFSRWDLSDFVRQSLKGILLDILMGVAVILGIVLLILRRFRYAVPIILVMPLVLVAEFLLMRLLGQTVNIMTLGGLSAAIGVIADNAIVLTEHHVHFRMQGSHKDALAAAMGDIVPITLWATLVTLVVFVPLALLSGVPGLFFGPLAVTLGSTILLSLAVAIILLPVFLKHFVEDAPLAAHNAEKEGLFSRAKRLYGRALTGILAHPKALSLGVALVAGMAVLVFTHIPSGFLPEWDEGDIVLDVKQPYGISIQESDRLSQGMEKLVMAVPEVLMHIRKTGTADSEPFLPANISEFQIQLRPDRKRSTFQVMDALRETLEKAYPDADVDLHQRLPDRLGDLTGEAKPIVVVVSATKPEALWQAANDVHDALEKVAGLNGVELDMPPSQQELKVIPNERHLALLGLNASDAYHYSQLALFGEEATQLQQGVQATPVRVFYGGDYRSNPASIPSIPVYTANGGVLPLGKLADYRQEAQFPEIHHTNGALTINVNAEISGRALSDVVRDVQTALAGLKREGVTYELAGNYKNQQTSFRELLMVLAFSVVLILAALLFVFDSWRTAMAVFLGTLASGTFVIFGLALTRTEFDVSSFTGMITVMGIVVNNGILVIDFVERERRGGMRILEALNAACGLRFRPVLITNLAAIAGFLPMALNLGQGGEVLRPFSIAMISGLVGSMAFSLLVMPAFYLLFNRGGDTAPGKTRAGQVQTIQRRTR
jgi:multidrug efflux pump subunit AcrB